MRWRLPSLSELTRGTPVASLRANHRVENPTIAMATMERGSRVRLRATRVAGAAIRSEVIRAMTFWCLLGLATERHAQYAMQKTSATGN